MRFEAIKSYGTSCLSLTVLLLFTLKNHYFEPGTEALRLFYCGTFLLPISG